VGIIGAALKCKWVATEEIEGRLELIEGKEFSFPVDPERGFFYYLENGMEQRQKEILAREGKRFLEEIKRMKAEKKAKIIAAAGLICKDENTKEGVVLGGRE
jgi:hypothetical protein